MGIPLGGVLMLLYDVFLCLVFVNTPWKGGGADGKRGWEKGLAEVSSSRWLVGDREGRAKTGGSRPFSFFFSFPIGHFLSGDFVVLW